MLAIGAMAIAAVLGLIFSQTLSVSADPDLSEDEIKERVQAQYPGEITTLELTPSGNDPIYEVELDIDGEAYSLTIDGNSGEVLQLDEKAMLAKEDQEKPDEQKNTDVVPSNKKEEASLQVKEKIEHKKPKDSEKETVNAPTEKESDKEQEKTEEKTETEKSVISTDRAIEIALGQFSGTVDDIELDTEDGRLIYEIEIESPSGEADIEIDAYTGEVLVVDIDLDD